jgi:hypothetical protein
MTTVHQATDGALIAYSKGAVEEVLAGAPYCSAPAETSSCHHPTASESGRSSTAWRPMASASWPSP